MECRPLQNARGVLTARPLEADTRCEVVFLSLLPGSPPSPTLLRTGQSFDGRPSTAKEPLDKLFNLRRLVQPGSAAEDQRHRIRGGIHREEPA